MVAQESAGDASSKWAQNDYCQMPKPNPLSQNGYGILIYTYIYIYISHPGIMNPPCGLINFPTENGRLSSRVIH